MIASLLFMGGLRRSEVAAVRWADVTDARDGDGVLLTVRTSKTNQEGDAAAPPAPDHPRACGELAETIQDNDTYSGSSPRMRGTRVT